LVPREAGWVVDEYLGLDELMLLRNDAEYLVTDDPGEAHHEHEVVLKGVHEVLPIAFELCAVGVDLRKAEL
jgi:hypothetical protein